MHMRRLGCWWLCLWVAVLLSICTAKGIFGIIDIATPAAKFAVPTSVIHRNGAASVTAKAITGPTASTAAAVIKALSEEKTNSSLSFFQNMIAGAASRSVAQTIMHPMNTYKTLLQLKDKGRSQTITPLRLLRGVDAQFLMSIPHGACYFVTLETIKRQLTKLLPSSNFGFLMDFSSSALSTLMCSVISTPQMVITDRLMAGVYPSLPAALTSILSTEGPRGFYTGWWPALAQKIPSYGLTWMFFQQLKRVHHLVLKRNPEDVENFLLGSIASATTVTLLMPMDTVKTRIVTQARNQGPLMYRGVGHAFQTILREEGVFALYRALPPRLLSVVPMVGIQLGVYELVKRRLTAHNALQTRIKIQACENRTQSEKK